MAWHVTGLVLCLMLASIWNAGTRNNTWAVTEEERWAYTQCLLLCIFPVLNYIGAFALARCILKRLGY